MTFNDHTEERSQSLFRTYYTVENTVVADALYHVQDRLTTDMRLGYNMSYPFVIHL